MEVTVTGLFSCDLLFICRNILDESTEDEMEEELMPSSKVIYQQMCIRLNDATLIYEQLIYSFIMN